MSKASQEQIAASLKSLVGQAKAAETDESCLIAVRLLLSGAAALPAIEYPRDPSGFEVLALLNNGDDTPYTILELGEWQNPPGEGGGLNQLEIADYAMQFMNQACGIGLVAIGVSPMLLRKFIVGGAIQYVRPLEFGELLRVAHRVSPVLGRWPQSQRRQIKPAERAAALLGAAMGNLAASDIVEVLLSLFAREGFEVSSVQAERLIAAVQNRTTPPPIQPGEGLEGWSDEQGTIIQNSAS